MFPHLTQHQGGKRWNLIDYPFKKRVPPHASDCRLLSGDIHRGQSRRTQLLTNSALIQVSPISQCVHPPRGVHASCQCVHPPCGVHASCGQRPTKKNPKHVHRVIATRRYSNSTASEGRKHWRFRRPTTCYVSPRIPSDGYGPPAKTIGMNSPMIVCSRSTPCLFQQQ